MCSVFEGGIFERGLEYNREEQLQAEEWRGIHDTLSDEHDETYKDQVLLLSRNRQICRLRSTCKFALEFINMCALRRLD